MRFVQKLVGIGGMPYLFLVPNLLFFGLFVIIPLFISFAYSVSGGTDLFLQNRPYVGGEQYGYLLDCGNALDPSTCREDRFWRGIYNTITFVTFQVGFMVLFSLITALVLNRKIKARGFFRSVYFFPVLLSPVVVALIWKWILLRDGLLNAAMHLSWRGENPVFRRSDLGDVLGDLRLDLGAYGLLHAHPPGRPPGDPARSLRGG